MPKLNMLFIVTIFFAAGIYSQEKQNDNQVMPTKIVKAIHDNAFLIAGLYNFMPLLVQTSYELTHSHFIYDLYCRFNRGWFMEAVLPFTISTYTAQVAIMTLVSIVEGLCIKRLCKACLA